MKVKTAVVSIVVSAALVCGAGYGAYYAMQGKKSPVEVVPVSNVNTGGYWGTSNSIYGTVTSQIAQNIVLDEEYSIDEIYVKAGDKVKEGTPLFSYDMTLPELQLEMEKLTLQAHELTMVKLEKDLAKLKGTTATASLEHVDYGMTTASEEELVVESMEEETPGQLEEGSSSGQSDLEISDSQPGGDQKGESSLEEGQNHTETDEETSEQTGESVLNGEDASIEVEKVETMEMTGDEETHLAVLDSVSSYENLVLVIDSLILAYGDDLRSEEIAGPIEEAVSYYRRNLAREQVVSGEDEQGNPMEETIYVIKDSVLEALGEEGTAKLEKYNERLALCQAKCVDIMIVEASCLEGEELSEAVAEIHESYKELETSVQAEVTNLTLLAALEESVDETEAGESEGNTETGESQSESEGNTETGESQSESEENTETGESQSESEENTETGESETGEAETESESDTEVLKSYTVEVQAPGSANVTEAVPGDVVVIVTDEQITGAEFESWRVQSDGTELDWNLLENLEADQANTSFVMPEMNVTLIPNYRIIPSEIDGYITNFEELAAKALEEESQSEEYRIRLGNAIDFYQQWLAELTSDILDGSGASACMDEYQLKTEVDTYLTSQNRAQDVQMLQDTYRTLCKIYVKEIITSLDPQALTGERLSEAETAYTRLGSAWQMELEEEWLAEQTANMDQSGSSAETEDENEDPEEDAEESDDSESQGIEVLTLAELLQAYHVILVIQELDFSKEESALKVDLAVAQEKYLALSDAQQQVVWNASVLIDALKQYGMWEETEPSGFSDGMNGFYDGMDGFEDSYTAEELKEMIEQTEREIKDCELSIRESEILVKQAQRIVDGKVVKSTMEGTVVSIGEEDGYSEDEYFAKITNTEGLYAKGSMNELSLETIKVGDTISGMMMDTGVSFTAVIKEISQYPTASNDYMYYSYGTENTNASYYEFYALLDDTTDIDEGEAEMQLSETMSDISSEIYLEKYFVRTDNTGKSYVYIQGEDGKLKKQYVTTGRLMYGFALEIISGLKSSDKIAFPYGSDVFEGAQTKEVDLLSAYM